MKFEEIYKQMPWQEYLDAFLKCSTNFSDYSTKAGIDYAIAKKIKKHNGQVIAYIVNKVPLDKRKPLEI